MAFLFMSVFLILFFQCVEGLNARIIVMRPNYIKVRQGNEATFRCSLLSDNAVDGVNWMLNGVQLTAHRQLIREGQRYSLNYEVSQYGTAFETITTLTIKSAQNGVDNGTYRCDVDNNPPLSKKAKLDITPPCDLAIIENHGVIIIGKEARKFFPGEQMSLSCILGYRKLNGNPTVTCQDNSTWSDVPLFCDRLSCGRVPEGVNAFSQTDSILFEGKAKYTCFIGFEMLAGNSTRRCGSDGNWTGMPLHCTRRSCGVPVVDRRTIQLGTNYLFEGTVSFVCPDGYQNVNGSFTIICQKDGKWNDSSLVCRRISCGAPSLLPNTMLYPQVNDTSVGDVARYACRPGYEPTGGNSSRTCGVEGQWNGTALQCSRRSCGAPDVDRRVIQLGSNYFFEDTVSFTCPYGYQNFSGSITIICQEDGTWSESALECQRISCGAPNKLPNSVLEVNDTAVGDIARYACIPGFEQSGGSSSRTCGEEGHWNGTPLQCATGNWLEWSALTECTATCGKGLRVTRRKCSFQGQVTKLTRCQGYSSTFIPCKAQISCTFLEDQKEVQDKLARQGYVDLVESRNMWYWLWTVTYISGVFMLLWYSRQMYLEEGLRLRRRARREFDYIILRIAALMKGDKQLLHDTIHCTKNFDTEVISENYEYVSRQLCRHGHGKKRPSTRSIPGPSKVTTVHPTIGNLFQTAFDIKSNSDNLDDLLETFRQPIKAGTSADTVRSLNFFSCLPSPVNKLSSFKSTFSQIRDITKTQVRTNISVPSVHKTLSFNKAKGRSFLGLSVKKVGPSVENCLLTKVTKVPNLPS